MFTRLSAGVAIMYLPLFVSQTLLMHKVKYAYPYHLILSVNTHKYLHAPHGHIFFYLFNIHVLPAGHVGIQDDKLCYHRDNDNKICSSAQTVIPSNLYCACKEINLGHEKNSNIALVFYFQFIVFTAYLNVGVIL